MTDTPPPFSTPPERGEVAARPALALEDAGAGRLRLWLDSVAAPGGLLSSHLLDLLDEALERVEALAAAGEARSLVLAARAPATFLAGLDPELVLGFDDARAASAFALRGQRVLRRLEQLPLPTVAAIQGGCLGAGLEVALACAHRVAADSPRTRLGLPELHVGLIPALGGTVRLPRLIGLQAALDLILAAEPVGAAAALRLGLVDAAVPAQQLLERADALAAAGADGHRGADRRRRVPRRLLEDTAPGRRVILLRARRRLIPENAPSPLAARRALEAVAEGVALPLERAFRREAKIFAQVATSPSARALLHASLLAQRATRGRGAEAPISQAAVLGAGEVGSELAYLLARALVPVRLKDRKRSAVGAGVQAAADKLRSHATARRLSATSTAERVELLEGAAGFGGFGTLDLAVAAVGDRHEVNRFALREAMEHTREECILASSSTLVSLAELEDELGRIGRVVGLHTPLSSDLFPVLEVAVTPATDPAAVAACLELARRMGRVALRVADRPGRLVTRLLGATLAEATRLVDEGATITSVDAALQDWGWSLGPFRRMDLMGLPRAAHLLEALAAALGPRFAPAPVLRRAAEAGGRFFRYRAGQPIAVNPALPAGLPGLGPEHREMMRERVHLLLLNEAALVLQEGVADGPDSVDLAALLGLGFPRARGGLLYHADQEGTDATAGRAEALAGRFGERFAPAPLLQRLARDSRGFYPRAGQSPARVL